MLMGSLSTLRDHGSWAHRHPFSGGRTTPRWCGFSGLGPLLRSYLRPFQPAVLSVFLQILLLPVIDQ